MSTRKIEGGIVIENAKRLRYAVVGALAAVLGAAVVGLGYAAAGPSASAQEYEYGQKVTICHHTGSKKNPHRTITVSRNALRAHLGPTGHGDTLGPCPSTRALRAHSSAAHVKKFHKQTTLRAEVARETKASKAKGKGKGKGKGKP